MLANVIINTYIIIHFESPPIGQNRYFSIVKWCFLSVSAFEHYCLRTYYGFDLQSYISSSKYDMSPFCLNK